MRWFKKIVRAILALIPVFSIFFISSPSYALRHDYAGVPFFNFCYPGFVQNNGTYSIDWSSQSSACNVFASSLRLEFDGDSYDPSYDNLTIPHSYSYSFVDSSNDMCFPRNSLSIFTKSSYNTLSISGQSIQVDAPQRINPPISSTCSRSRNEFGTNGVPQSDLADINPAAILTCDVFSNGANCGGLWNQREFISDQVLPHWYSSDGFYIHSHYIDTSTGYHYNNSFTFSSMFNNYIPTFSYLNIPLHEYDGYFHDPSNLYSGRDIEFSGAFEFDGSFEWHDNIENNGSSFKIAVATVDTNNVSSPVDIDCSTNLITLDNLTRLEYSCPYTLTKDYLIFNPALNIQGNGNYVWKTDKEWRFAYSYLTTDNDDTPGRSFNSSLTGGGYIAGSAENLVNKNDGFAVIIDGVNFTDSLIYLFGFSFINPFAPLLNMFTSQESCAQIPTLAGMLHSESSEVCPWFPPQVRSITTPVLSIASVMLIFGFAVRWLGSSSGNMFEDASHETSNYSFSNKYRRNK